MINRLTVGSQNWEEFGTVYDFTFFFFTLKTIHPIFQEKKNGIIRGYKADDI